jgi:indolepyruvate ferredoxin oxidoreductase, alpha subunit
MDTTACMGASIGQALGMVKAGIDRDKVVAIIGDSTFLHSGITPLVDAVYDRGEITVIILDNGTTAMTGHQEHPGTGKTVQGKETNIVKLEDLVKGIGVNRVKVVDAFDIKELRSAVKESLSTPELSVIIARGNCAVHRPKRSAPSAIDEQKCKQCGTCLLIGCPAIQSQDNHVYIDVSLCIGSHCGICQQICSHHAIGSVAGKGVANTP